MVAHRRCETTCHLYEQLFISILRCHFCAAFDRRLKKTSRLCRLQTILFCGSVVFYNSDGFVTLILNPIEITAVIQYAANLCEYNVNAHRTRTDMWPTPPTLTLCYRESKQNIFRTRTSFATVKYTKQPQRTCNHWIVRFFSPNHSTNPPRPTCNTITFTLLCILCVSECARAESAVLSSQRKLCNFRFYANLENNFLCSWKCNLFIRYENGFVVGGAMRCGATLRSGFVSSASHLPPAPTLTPTFNISGFPSHYTMRRLPRCAHFWFGSLARCSLSLIHTDTHTHELTRTQLP